MVITKDGTNISLPLILKVARHVFENAGEEDIQKTLGLAEDVTMSTIGHGFLRILPLIMDLNPDILVEINLLMSILVHLDRTIQENGFGLSFLEEVQQLEPSSEAGSTNTSKRGSNTSTPENLDHIFDPESF